jgi:transcriptional regulator GlxA family with amidase domain
MNERTTTRSDYAERLERVFRWLAEHLDDTLDLTRLADVACPVALSLPSRVSRDAG